jgi:hypothetical protein
MITMVTILALSCLFATLQAETSESCKRPIITIWIHGTLVPLVSRLWRSFFFVPQGLVPITCVDPSLHIYTIAKTLHDHDPLNFPLETFYCFGWSGTLSCNARLKAARQLYRELCALMSMYEKKHAQKPYLRIITHSHGGNVALNLAYVKESHNALCVDELVLLACPVQKKTEAFCTDPLFKRVVSLYSKADLIQVLDPQRLWYFKRKTPLFSERCFPEADNLVQVEVFGGTRNIGHIDFLRDRFVKHIPPLIKKFGQSKAYHHHVVRLITC